MGFTYANVKHANVAHAKHVTMFVKITIFTLVNGFRYIWIFLNFFTNLKIHEELRYLIECPYIVH